MEELRLVPTLQVTDVEAAISFYTRAFSAKESRRLLSPDGFSLLGASLSFGSYHIDVRSHANEKVSPHRASMIFTLFTSSCTAFYEAALQEGAQAHSPPQELPDGSTHAQCIDPFGYQWILRSTPTES